MPRPVSDVMVLMLCDGTLMVRLRKGNILVDFSLSRTAPSVLTGVLSTSMVRLRNGMTFVVFSLYGISPSVPTDWVICVLESPSVVTGVGGGMVVYFCITSLKAWIATAFCDCGVGRNMGL